MAVSSSLCCGSLGLAIRGPPESSPAPGPGLAGAQLSFSCAHYKAQYLSLSVGLKGPSSRQEAGPGSSGGSQVGSGPGLCHSPVSWPWEGKEAGEPAEAPSLEAGGWAEVGRQALSLDGVSWLG